MCGCIQDASVRPASNMKMGNYSIVKQSRIAEGAYGNVWKCRSSNGDTLYALKEIILQSLELQKMYNKQKQILTKLKQRQAKGVINLLQSEIIQTKQYKIGCMLFQFGTISLFDQIRSKKFTDQYFLKVLLEISLGLSSIHQCGIVHLDVKPQNIILVDGCYKFCDFGSAIEGQVKIDSLNRKQKLQFEQYIEANSTLMYRSPEMIDSDNKTIGYSSDIWMLGCIAYLMLFRKHPFEGKGKLAIISQDLKYPTNSQLSQLISSFLKQNINQRISIGQIIHKIQSLLTK